MWRTVEVESILAFLEEMMDTRLWVIFLVAVGFYGAVGAEEKKPMRAGIIGLDTSHVSAFTKLFNDSKATGDIADVKIVAAFPGGSQDIPSSRDRIEGFKKELSGLGVEMVDSIPALMEKVDVVLLESVDGRPHL